jgi:hypothetical protein
MLGIGVAATAQTNAKFKHLVIEPIQPAVD